ncbi:MAG TPA: hypothetical protein VMM15_06715 [Bradyrhizobium sp.]|nr:hypothetical protein [Bradyrhizobium sp.]
MSVSTDSIVTKEDLADFIDSLRVDFLANSEEWENVTIDRFLEAMAAWVRSMENYYRNTGREPIQSPSWSVFADMLSAAKIYE